MSGGGSLLIGSGRTSNSNVANRIEGRKQTGVQAPPTSSSAVAIKPLTGKKNQKNVSGHWDLCVDNVLASAGGHKNRRSRSVRKNPAGTLEEPGCTSLSRT